MKLRRTSHLIHKSAISSCSFLSSENHCNFHDMNQILPKHPFNVTISYHINVTICHPRTSLDNTLAVVKLVFYVFRISLSCLYTV